MGRVAEFSEDGKLVAVWNDGGKLSAPWGMAFAPDNFGALSGALLASNFGNGESLSDKNALYYAAGPKDEADGLFGSLRPAN